MKTISPCAYFTNPNASTTIAASLSSGAVLCLSREEAALLRQGIPDEGGEFVRTGLLVDDAAEVFHAVCRRHQEACRSPAVLNLTVLPTLSCNFSCDYCFERGVTGAFMDDAVSECILRYVEKQAPQHLRTDLAWFGGEPLLALDRIVRLHGAIRSCVEATGAAFFSNMTTNGYLLDQAAARTLRDLGIRFVQITLDGSSQVHDSQRKTKSGLNTFDRILSNMTGFLSGWAEASVTLRVNVSPGTELSILEVLPSIPAQLRKRISVHLHRVMPASCPEGFPGELASRLRAIYMEARRLGFAAAVDHYLDPGPAVYCYAERATGAVIAPSGAVYRCAYTDFSERERIGFLSDDGTIVRSGPWLDTWEALVAATPEKCSRCTFLPVCGFGCPRLRGQDKAASLDCRNRFSFLPDTLAALYGQSTVNGP